MIIDPLYFVVSFLIGLFYIHYTKEPPKVVIKYPTPQNVGKVTYVDDAGVCYKYAMSKSSCPKNRKDVINMPIQVGPNGYLKKLKKQQEQMEKRKQVDNGPSILTRIKNFVFP